MGLKEISEKLFPKAIVDDYDNEIYDENEYVDGDTTVASETGFSAPPHRNRPAGYLYVQRHGKREYRLR